MWTQRMWVGGSTIMKYTNVIWIEDEFHHMYHLSGTVHNFFFTFLKFWENGGRGRRR